MNLNDATVPSQYNNILYDLNISYDFEIDQNAMKLYETDRTISDLQDIFQDLPEFIGIN